VIKQEPAASKGLLGKRKPLMSLEKLKNLDLDDILSSRKKSMKRRREF